MGAHSTVSISHTSLATKCVALKKRRSHVQTTLVKLQRNRSVIEPTGLNAVAVDSVERIEVGPGCYRRDLPSRPGMRLWIVEMDAGAEWPRVDHHDAGGEDIFVASGALIEGERRFEAGTFIRGNPNSSHRPKTDVGVRLVGVNLL